MDFALSGGLDAGFMKNGHPIELARMRAKVGCNWTALPGIEYCLQDVTRLCLITPMLMALDDMMADSTSSRTMDELWARYAEHLSIVVEATKVGKDLHMERQSRNYPEIVLNLFCHGPIERGLDVAAGGVDIVDLAFDAVGLATVADSFAAIEQRVVDEQRLSWEALMQHLRNDFKGAEPVRLMLNSIPGTAVAVRVPTGGQSALPIFTPIWCATHRRPRGVSPASPASSHTATPIVMDNASAPRPTDGTQVRPSRTAPIPPWLPARWCRRPPPRRTPLRRRSQVGAIQPAAGRVG